MPRPQRSRSTVAGPSGPTTHQLERFLMARMSLTTKVAVLVAVLASLTVPLGGNPVAAAPEAPQLSAQEPVQPDAGGPRLSRMSLALVSRTYNPSTDNWTIVAEARLTSNRICLPIAFNCIVGEVASPSNASLTDLSCESLFWNHLLVFRNHCLKELFWAGHHQHFRFTWTTDAGVSTGTVELGVEFGRGFLPVVFQQLAVATLTVDLGTPALEIFKTCPATVDSGGTLTCQVTVSHPLPKGGSGPDVTGISVTDAPDSALDALTSGDSFTKTAGDGTWNCSGLECTIAALSAGQSTTFQYQSTVNATSTGGAGANTAAVAWTGPTGGDRQATADVVVVGNGDTSVEIKKSTTQTQVAPGGQVSWTVEVENKGPLDTLDVVVSDLAPVGVEGMSLTYASGTGTWNCSSVTCTAVSMGQGKATFNATGTLSTGAAPDTAIVNEVEVRWDNDILGPDFPITAGSAIPVVAAATTTTTPGGTTPSTPSGSEGAPLSIVG